MSGLASGGAGVVGKARPGIGTDITAGKRLEVNAFASLLLSQAGVDHVCHGDAPRFFGLVPSRLSEGESPPRQHVAA